MKVVAAVLAAGRGARFGGDKSVALLAGRPLWLWSFQALSSHPRVDAVGIVCSQENLPMIRELAKGASFAVVGGGTRQQSSLAALNAAPEDTDLLLIHDGARPILSSQLIDAVIDAAARTGAAAPGLKPTDTFKLRSPDGLRTLDREQMVSVQTPQGVLTSILRRGHSLVSDATDDLALAEAAEVIPEIVPGDPDNIKVTSPEDMARAEEILAGRMAKEVSAKGEEEAQTRVSEMRTGIGYDIHSFSADPSRVLMLGGVPFPGARALDGHSDADVLLHAITDALLGAGALGDIGEHFPNTDERWRGEPSGTFLRHAAGLLAAEGWRIQNVDATVIAEEPKLSASIHAMRESIAALLGIEPGRVGVKATTNERLGAIGRGEGIAAMAAASIAR